MDNQNDSHSIGALALVTSLATALRGLNVSDLAPLTDAIDTIALGGDESAKIREIVARELGGPIDDAADAEQAFREAQRALRGALEEGDTIDETEPGTLGHSLVAIGRRAPDPEAQILDLTASQLRGARQSIALRQILIIAEAPEDVVAAAGPLPFEPLDEGTHPGDVLVAVYELAKRAVAAEGELAKRKACTCACGCESRARLRIVAATKGELSDGHKLFEDLRDPGGAA